MKRLINAFLLLLFVGLLGPVPVRADSGHRAVGVSSRLPSCRPKRKRHRKPRRPKPAPAPEPTPPAAPALSSPSSAGDPLDSGEGDLTGLSERGAAASAAPTGTGLRRSNRMEFDARLVKGQKATSGAVYLFQRAPRPLPPLLSLKQSYLDRIVEPVLGELAAKKAKESSR